MSEDLQFFRGGGGGIECDIAEGDGASIGEADGQGIVRAEEVEGEAGKPPRGDGKVGTAEGRRAVEDLEVTRIADVDEIRIGVVTGIEDGGEGGEVLIGKVGVEAWDGDVGRLSEASGENCTDGVIGANRKVIECVIAIGVGGCGVKVSRTCRDVKSPGVEDSGGSKGGVGDAQLPDPVSGKTVEIGKGVERGCVRAGKRCCARVD